MASMADDGKGSGNRPPDWLTETATGKMVPLSREEALKYICEHFGDVLAPGLKQWIKIIPKRNSDRIRTDIVQDILIHNLLNHFNDCRQLQSRVVPNKGAVKKTRRKQSKTA